MTTRKSVVEQLKVYRSEGYVLECALNSTDKVLNQELQRINHLAAHERHLDAVAAWYDDDYFASQLKR